MRRQDYREQVNGLLWKTFRKQGIESFYVPAAAMQPTITNGAIIGLAELSSNVILAQTLGFPDGATTYKAQFGLVLPKSYNLGTLTARFYWTANSASTNSVVWQMRARAYADDDALDQALGTAVTVTDANKSAVYKLNKSDESGALTIGGGILEEEYTIFEVFRDPTNGSDNLAATAELLGVMIKYTTNRRNDA